MPAAQLSEIAKLPKVELHAHLHGSLTRESLREILGASAPEALFNRPTTLADCFSYFSVVHKALTNAESAERLYNAALENFYNDGVRYLELRTTPKIYGDVDTTHQYMSLLERCCDRAEKLHQDFTIKILLSLNREQCGSGEDATKEATRQLLLLHRDFPRVVGIDISGNPRKGSMHAMLQGVRAALREEMKSPAALMASRECRLAVHTGEVDAEEALEVLSDATVDRLGHCCHMSDDAMACLLGEQRRRCVEICPSSALVMMELKNLDEHRVLRRLVQNNYPIAVCTDDVGLFSNSLSEELALMAKTFNWSISDIAQLQRTAVQASFASAEEKEKLLETVFASEQKVQCERQAV